MKHASTCYQILKIESLTKHFSPKTFCIGLIFFLSSCASTKFAQVDSETDEKMILGQCTFSEWKQFSDWTNFDAPDYTPDSSATQIISNYLTLSSESLILFGGTWCGDSKAEFPKYFKLFKLAHIPEEKVALFGVSRKKKESSKTAELYNIKRVPTLVVLRNGLEIGRIVEYPTESIEKDLIGILTK